jgi:lipopolysaccharide/colanic/teichoic acid biosynthesis glycosyltransferase
MVPKRGIRDQRELRGRMRLKRAVDIVLGSLLAVAALPVIVLLAVGSAISLRAWPLFVQERVGKDGREFRFPKLRTLPTSAPPATDKYALTGTKIPSFCRFLRRTHLDELPQLVLVPAGLMSLVGPRPEMPTVLRRYPIEFAQARTSVRPGCTGLWQLSDNATRLIFEAPEYDLAYLQRAGGRLDLWVLYRTVRSWLPGGGTIALDDIPAWVSSPSLLPNRPRVTEPAVRGLEPAGAMLSPAPAAAGAYDWQAEPVGAAASMTLQGAASTEPLAAETNWSS